MRLFGGIVFGDESFLQHAEIAFFEIKVRSRDYFLAFVRDYPVDNLRRVGAEKGAVVFVEWFAVFA